MAARWARLCAVFFLVGLATSRVTLVLHEFAGHGGAATLLGGRVVAYSLFLFGGGWLRYEWGPEHGLAASITVSVAGIALEIAVAAAALGAAALPAIRRRPVAEVALVGLATADLLHAGFYLAAGTQHGFGDGRLLHTELGAARAAIVAPACAAVLVASLVLARRLARLTGAWAGARSRRGRAAALVLAASVAALAHGALTLSERGLSRDATYSRIMKSESERRAGRDLARLAAEARRQGTPLDERALAAMRAELERKYGGFPLAPVLAVCIALACAAGVWWGVASTGVGHDRTAAGERGPAWRAVIPLAAFTAAAFALVAALRGFA